MAQETEIDGWTHIRIRTSLIEEIKKFLKKNPAFDNQTYVVEFAVKQLLEKGVTR